MKIYGKVVGRDHASYAMNLHNLGELNKSQVHSDTSLKATERLSLVEILRRHGPFEKQNWVTNIPIPLRRGRGYRSTLAVQVLYQDKYVERGEKGGRQSQ
jgi:hypothetical protein